MLWKDPTLNTQPEGAKRDTASAENGDFPRRPHIPTTLHGSGEEESPSANRFSTPHPDSNVEISEFTRSLKAGSWFNRTPILSQA